MPAGRVPDLLQWLDMVALGTVCDVVPLIGLNRALVAQGLKVMAGAAMPASRRWPTWPGSQDKPDAYHLGYVLGPRVNAGGRVGQADLGVRLLATDDPAEAARHRPQCSTASTSDRQEIEAAVAAGGHRAGRRAAADDGRRWWWPRARAGIPAWSASSPGASRSATTGRPA